MGIILKIIGRVNRILNILNLRRKKVKYGNNLKIRGRIHIYGSGEIVIGHNVTINSNERSNPIGGMTATILSTTERGSITIGDNCGISNTAVICKCSISIGNNVFIGGNCKIYDTDFHSLDSSIRGSEEDCGNMKPVVIGDDVFIGAHSIILKGVTIGNGSIIGAGAVVTKNVGSNEIWAGNPAKLIRRVV